MDGDISLQVNPELEAAKKKLDQAFANYTKELKAVDEIIELRNPRRMQIGDTFSNLSKKNNELNDQYNTLITAKSKTPAEETGIISRVRALTSSRRKLADDELTRATHTSTARNRAITSKKPLTVTETPEQNLISQMNKLTAEINQQTKNINNPQPPPAPRVLTAEQEIKANKVLLIDKEVPDKYEDIATILKNNQAAIMALDSAFIAARQSLMSKSMISKGDITRIDGMIDSHNYNHQLYERSLKNIDTLIAVQKSKKSSGSVDDSALRSQLNEMKQSTEYMTYLKDQVLGMAVSFIPAPPVKTEQKASVKAMPNLPPPPPIINRPAGASTTTPTIPQPIHPALTQNTSVSQNANSTMVSAASLRDSTAKITAGLPRPVGPSNLIQPAATASEPDTQVTILQKITSYNKELQAFANRKSQPGMTIQTLDKSFQTLKQDVANYLKEAKVDNSTQEFENINHTMVNLLKSSSDTLNVLKALKSNQEPTVPKELPSEGIKPIASR